jgi:hypothetical protein
MAWYSERRRQLAAVDVHDLGLDAEDAGALGHFRFAPERQRASAVPKRPTSPLVIATNFTFSPEAACRAATLLSPSTPRRLGWAPNAMMRSVGPGEPQRAGWWQRSGGSTDSSSRQYSRFMGVLADVLFFRLTSSPKRRRVAEGFEGGSHRVQNFSRTDSTAIRCREPVTLRACADLHRRPTGLPRAADIAQCGGPLLPRRHFRSRSRRQPATALAQFSADRASIAAARADSNFTWKVARELPATDGRVARSSR